MKHFRHALLLIVLAIALPAQAQVMQFGQPEEPPQTQPAAIQEPQIESPIVPDPQDLFTPQQASLPGGPTQTQAAERGEQHVVLLHGMGHGPLSMNGFEQVFEKAGYQVDSPKLDLERETLHVIIDEAYRDIRRFSERDPKTVHFVCYSQGCLVARGIIEQHRPVYLGRVVMLGPPNQGGEMIDYLRQRQIGIFATEGKHLPNLGTANRWNLARLIGTRAEGYDLGIIAGTENPMPLNIRVPGANQTILGPERTQLEGMKEFVTVKTPHDDLYRDPVAQQMAVTFINSGSFVADDQPKP